MKADDVRPGAAIHRGDPVTVDRYTTGARINHWITATCLILLALSGLALFHPSLFFLTSLFGGGQATRAIHPWIGVILFFSFAGLFLRFWRLNLWQGADTTWLVRLNKVLGNRDHEDPELVEIGKYNAGQKIVAGPRPQAVSALHGRPGRSAASRSGRLARTRAAGCGRAGTRKDFRHAAARSQPLHGRRGA